MNAYHCCHLDGAAVCQSTDVYSPFLYTHTHTQAHTTHTNTKVFPSESCVFAEGVSGWGGGGGLSPNQSSPRLLLIFVTAVRKAAGTVHTLLFLTLLSFSQHACFLYSAV